MSYNNQVYNINKQNTSTVEIVESLPAYDEVAFDISMGNGNVRYVTKKGKVYTEIFIGDRYNESDDVDDDDLFEIQRNKNLDLSGEDMKSIYENGELCVEKVPKIIFDKPIKK